MLTERFDDALLFAHEVHRRQKRKGTGIPYVSHLLAVASLVLEHGGTEDQAIAGLLHDAAEDQGGEEMLARIREKFGERVARIVADCTDTYEEPKPPWRPRKEAYIASTARKSAESLLVSLADKVHNARSILVDLRRHGPALWERFAGGRETIWYYESLARAFRDAQGARSMGALIEELEHTVEQIRAADR